MLYNYEQNMKWYPSGFNATNFGADFRNAYDKALQGNMYGANVLLGRYHNFPVISKVYGSLGHVAQIAKEKNPIVSKLRHSGANNETLVAAYNNYKEWHNVTRREFSNLRKNLTEQYAAQQFAHNANHNL